MKSALIKNKKKSVKIDDRTNNSNYYDDNKINDIRNYNKIMITIIMMMMITIIIIIIILLLL